MRGLVVMVLAACGGSPAPSSPPTVAVDTRLDAAAPLVVEDPPRPPASPKPLGTCADAIADAKAKSDMGWKDEGDELDADGDGVPECVLRACSYANCQALVYRREPGGVRRIGELRVSRVSHPHCVDRPKGFCRIEVGVLMIHGEIQIESYEWGGETYVPSAHP